MDTMRWECRPAIYPDDAILITPHVRLCDQREWAASVRGGVKGNLEPLMKASDECFTLTLDDYPEAIMGVVDRCVWMLGTDVSDNYGLALMYRFKPQFQEFFERWPSTYCFSDERNPRHHRWLEWLGYRLSQTRPWGILGLPFREYHKGMAQCA